MKHFPMFFLTESLYIDIPHGFQCNFFFSYKNSNVPTLNLSCCWIAVKSGIYMEQYGTCFSSKFTDETINSKYVPKSQLNLIIHNQFFFNKKTFSNNSGSDVITKKTSRTL